jgi:prepilin-type N-terminal cleavage/methylation domain-containing protein/prepilin-type processing-associated H-X9-DG protein
MQKNLSGSPRRGFTLVELLVVIGIIAVLIGILLPTLGNVQRNSRAAKCGSNLSQIAKAALTYTALNKGIYPIGYEPLGFTITANPLGDSGALRGVRYTVSGSYTGWKAWFTVINNAIQGSKNAPNYVSSNGEPFPVPSGSFSIGYKLPEYFRCAAVTGGEFEQQVHYYANSAVFIHPIMEAQTATATPFSFTGYRRLMGATLRRDVSDVPSDTALFWDTPVMAGLPSNFTLPIFSGNGNEDPPSFPYAVVAPLIDSWGSSPDNQRLNENGIVYPGIRYRYKGRNHTDSLPATGPNSKETRGFEQPVLFPTDEEFQLYASFNGAGKSANSDVGANTVLGVQIGNLRFRHGNNDTVQAAFADGSVRSFKLNRRRTFGGGQFYWNDFKRVYLMTNPPTTTIYRTP